MWKKTTYVVVELQVISHLHWKDHFHKQPLYFSMYADFEAINDFDNSSIGNKTTNNCKQNQYLMVIKKNLNCKMF